MKPDVRTSAAFIFTMYSNYINLFEKMICVAFRLCSVALESESVHPSMLCFSEKINILSVILTYFPHYSMAVIFYHCLCNHSNIYSLPEASNYQCKHFDAVRCFQSVYRWGWWRFALLLSSIQDSLCFLQHSQPLSFVRLLTPVTLTPFISSVLSSVESFWI